jgi:hypothetical protein
MCMGDDVLNHMSHLNVDVDHMLDPLLSFKMERLYLENKFPTVDPNDSSNVDVHSAQAICVCVCFARIWFKVQKEQSFLVYLDSKRAYITRDPFSQLCIFSKKEVFYVYLESLIWR